QGRGRAQAERGRGRGPGPGGPPQERVPRQYVPRAPDTAERDPRVQRDDPRRGVRGGAAWPEGAAGRYPEQWEAPVAAHQQRPRSLEGRGGAEGARPHPPLRPRPCPTGALPPPPP